MPAFDECDCVCSCERVHRHVQVVPGSYSLRPAASETEAAKGVALSPAERVVALTDRRAARAVCSPPFGARGPSASCRELCVGVGPRVYMSCLAFCFVVVCMCLCVCYVTNVHLS